ncbi:NfeD family protein [Alteraurantiacibacter aquimixticola]|uniref:NfeD family protein n=1 Tax=Alteraurantiacibacter aquimixticola TaxID=2489173 RepID=A0A4T3EW72_9SPHN|nr:NfeD family protein [Alteraurantiacibacter aquimixticola]TIX48786.1 NfeD family protein [Alteraurantiacibacter aquimixticola]
MGFLEGTDAAWAWVALGLVLAILEMLVPGVYLIWFAVAAIITGALTGLFDLSLTMQVIDFAFLALIAVFSARRFFRDQAGEGPDPLLNRRGAQLVGQVALVTQAIEHGSGRVHIGDSEWTAKGPDVEMGQRVRVTGSEGTALLVEPVGLLTEDNPTKVED